MQQSKWQKQRSYREARDKLVRSLAVYWYADINRQLPDGDRTYPLITWSGIPAKPRGGITDGEYLW